MQDQQPLAAQMKPKGVGHARRQLERLLEPALGQRQALALRPEHDGERPRRDGLGRVGRRLAAGRERVGRLGKVREDVQDRDDVASLGLRGREEGSAARVVSKRGRRARRRRGKAQRTSNALNGLPLNSLTNSAAASEDRSWIRTIEREGEMSRMRRRHSMSVSIAWT